MSSTRKQSVIRYGNSLLMDWSQAGDKKTPSNCYVWVRVAGNYYRTSFNSKEEVQSILDKSFSLQGFVQKIREKSIEILTMSQYEERRRSVLLGTRKRS